LTGFAGGVSGLPFLEISTLVEISVLAAAELCAFFDSFGGAIAISKEMKANI
jgi:hypothetical protein